MSTTFVPYIPNGYLNTEEICTIKTVDGFEAPKRQYAVQSSSNSTFVFDESKGIHRKFFDWFALQCGQAMVVEVGVGFFVVADKVSSISADEVGLFFQMKGNPTTHQCRDEVTGGERARRRENGIKSPMETMGLIVKC